MAMPAAASRLARGTLQNREFMLSPAQLQSLR